MDLSKAHECLHQDLIFAKPEAYGLRWNSLKILLDYVKRHKQRVKISFSYSTWPGLNRGVPQRTSLGYLLLNDF